MGIFHDVAVPLSVGVQCPWLIQQYFGVHCVEELSYSSHPSMGTPWEVVRVFQDRALYPSVELVGIDKVAV